MRHQWSFFVVLPVLAMSAAMAREAPPVQRPTTAQLHAAMEKLNWMIGKWEGFGWVDSATLGRREFPYSQNVHSEFNDLLLVVDGVGFSVEDQSTIYAEQLLISGPPPAVALGPPGTYMWQESGPGTYIRGNEAQGTGHSLQSGMPPVPRLDCDRIVDSAYRDICLRDPQEMWFRATISLNDMGEWIETREWQDNEGPDRKWHTYFKVVLHRVEPGGQ